MPPRFLVLSGLLLVCLTNTANAEVFTFAGREIALDPPQGWCRLEESRPAEADKIALQRKIHGTANHLVMVYTPCDELAALRAGQRAEIGLLGGITIIQQDGAIRPAPGLSRASFLDQLVRSIPGLDINSVMQASRERALGPDARGPAYAVPVVRQDEFAAYLGSSAKIAVGDGREIVLNAVNAVTLLNGLPVGMSIAALGDISLDTLFAQQQRNAATLVAANLAYEPGWFGRLMGATGWMSAVRGALIGVIIALLCTIGMMGQKWWRARQAAGEK